MAASFNKVLLLGNLTRDPELRYIPSGQAVTTFTVAVNRSYAAATGEKKEEVSFLRIVVWGRHAEVCNEYLKKGSSVFVEGRLQSRSWEAQDGTKRSTVEVVAQTVQFLGKPTGGGKQQASEESIPLPAAAEEAIIEDSFGAPAQKSGRSGAGDHNLPEEPPF